MYKTMLIALIIGLLSGCATQQLADNQLADQLVEGHGWLAINVSTPNDEIAFELTAGKVGSERFKTPLYDKGQSIKVMQLPVGYYRLSGVYDRGIIWKFVHPEALDDFAFNVTPGGLTLLGQVTLNGDTMSLQPLADNGSQTVLNLATRNIGTDIQRVTTDNTMASIWDLGLYCAGRVRKGFGSCPNARGFGRLSQGPR